jgi:hypothetical protein
MKLKTKKIHKRIRKKIRKIKGIRTKMEKTTHDKMKLKDKIIKKNSTKQRRKKIKNQKNMYQIQK